MLTPTLNILYMHSHLYVHQIRNQNEYISATYATFVGEHSTHRVPFMIGKWRRLYKKSTDRQTQWIVTIVTQRVVYLTPIITEDNVVDKKLTTPSIYQLIFINWILVHSCLWEDAGTHITATADGWIFENMSQLLVTIIYHGTHIYRYMILYETGSFNVGSKL